MKYGVNSYSAAGSEFVGAFLSGLVAKSPDKFIAAVRSLPVPTQNKVCYFAGLADGGGMGDLWAARKNLRKMTDDVAAREIEKANKPE